MLLRLIITLLVIAMAFAAFELLRRRHLLRLSEVSGWNRKQGHPALLYFHGQQCPTCLTQARYLQLMASHFQDLVVSIEVTEEAEVAREYGVLTLPTTIILDKTGAVQHVNYGLANAARLSRQLAGVA